MAGKLTDKALGMAVAKEVMGWTWVEPGLSWDEEGALLPTVTDYEQCENLRLEHCLLVTELDSSGCRSQRFWAGWHDWNDMREVIDRMLELGFSVSIFHNGNKFAAPWDARFTDYDDDARRALVIGEILPEAVLRAALETVSEGKGG